MTEWQKNTLREHARSIRAAAKSRRAGKLTTAEYALEVGNLLCAASLAAGRGWAAFLRRAGLSPGRARAYMRVDRNWQAVADAEGPDAAKRVSIRNALALIRDWPRRLAEAERDIADAVAAGAVRGK